MDNHTCRVCQEYFSAANDRIPVILIGCGHTICSTCAENQAHYGTGSSSANPFPTVLVCPSCHLETFLPSQQQQQQQKQDGNNNNSSTATSEEEKKRIATLLENHQKELDRYEQQASALRRAGMPVPKPPTLPSFSSPTNNNNARRNDNLSISSRLPTNYGLLPMNTSTSSMAANVLPQQQQFDNSAHPPCPTHNLPRAFYCPSHGSANCIRCINERHRDCPFKACEVKEAKPILLQSLNNTRRTLESSLSRTEYLKESLTNHHTKVEKRIYDTHCENVLDWMTKCMEIGFQSLSNAHLLHHERMRTVLQRSQELDLTQRHLHGALRALDTADSLPATALVDSMPLLKQTVEVPDVSIVEEEMRAIDHPPGPLPPSILPQFAAQYGERVLVADHGWGFFNERNQGKMNPYNNSNSSTGGDDTNENNMASQQWTSLRLIDVESKSVVCSLLDTNKMKELTKVSDQEKENEKNLTGKVIKNEQEFPSLKSPNGICEVITEIEIIDKSSMAGMLYEAQKERLEHLGIYEEEYDDEYSDDEDNDNNINNGDGNHNNQQQQYSSPGSRNFYNISPARHFDAANHYRHRDQLPSSASKQSILSPFWKSIVTSSPSSSMLINKNLNREEMHSASLRMKQQQDNQQRRKIKSQNKKKNGGRNRPTKKVLRTEFAICDTLGHRIVLIDATTGKMTREFSQSLRGTCLNEFSPFAACPVMVPIDEEVTANDNNNNNNQQTKRSNNTTTTNLSSPIRQNQFDSEDILIHQQRRSPEGRENINFNSTFNKTTTKTRLREKTAALVVTDCDNHRVYLIDAETGDFLRYWGNFRGTSSDEFWSPLAVTQIPDSPLFAICDSGNHRIVMIHIGHSGSLFSIDLFQGVKQFEFQRIFPSSLCVIPEGTRSQIETIPVKTDDSFFGTAQHGSVPHNNDNNNNGGGGYKSSVLARSNDGIIISDEQRSISSASSVPAPPYPGNSNNTSEYDYNNGGSSNAAGSRSASHGINNSNLNNNSNNNPSEAINTTSHHQFVQLAIACKDSEKNDCVIVLDFSFVLSKTIRTRYDNGGPTMFSGIFSSSSTTSQKKNNNNNSEATTSVKLSKIRSQPPRTLFEIPYFKEASLSASANTSSKSSLGNLSTPHRSGMSHQARHGSHTEVVFDMLNHEFNRSANALEQLQILNAIAPCPLSLTTITASSMLQSPDSWTRRMFADDDENDDDDNKHGVQEHSSTFMFSNNATTSNPNNSNNSNNDQRKISGSSILVVSDRNNRCVWTIDPQTGRLHDRIGGSRKKKNDSNNFFGAPSFVYRVSQSLRVDPAPIEIEKLFKPPTPPTRSQEQEQQQQSQNRNERERVVFPLSSDSNNDSSSPSLKQQQQQKSEQATSSSPSSHTRMNEVLAKEQTAQSEQREKDRLKQQQELEEKSLNELDPTKLEPRRRLTRFYNKYNRSKLASVDGLLNQFKGAEEALFRSCVTRYGPEPTEKDDAKIYAIDPRSRLVRFYQKYNNAKLENIDRTLQQFEGMLLEETLFKMLIEKYGEEPIPGVNFNEKDYISEEEFLEKRKRERLVEFERMAKTPVTISVPTRTGSGPVAINDENQQQQHQLKMATTSSSSEQQPQQTQQANNKPSTSTLSVPHATSSSIAISRSSSVSVDDPLSLQKLREQQQQQQQQTRSTVRQQQPEVSTVEKTVDSKTVEEKEQSPVKPQAQEQQDRSSLTAATQRPTTVQPPAETGKDKAATTSPSVVGETPVAAPLEKEEIENKNEDEEELYKIDDGYEYQDYYSDKSGSKSPSRPRTEYDGDENDRGAEELDVDDNDTVREESEARKEEEGKKEPSPPSSVAPAPGADAKKLSPSPPGAKAPTKVPGKTSSPTKTAPPKAVAGKKAASASAVVVKPAANDAEWTTRLTAFYKKYNPEKLSSVDSTMKQWKGKEVSLFQNLIFKYGEEPAPEVADSKKEEPKVETTEPKLVDEKKEEEPVKPTIPTPAAEAKKLSPSPSSVKAPAKVPGKASPTKTPPAKAVAGKKASSASAVVVKPAANDAEWTTRLTAFYKKYNPEKLSSVDSTMKQWKGKEVSLFQNLIFKYGEEPVPEVTEAKSQEEKKEETEVKPVDEKKKEISSAAETTKKDEELPKKQEEPANTPAAEAKKLSPSPSSTKAPVKAPAKAPAKVPSKASPTKTSSSPTKTAPPKAVAGKKAASANSVVVKPAANDAEWTTRLTAFYKKYNPEKLSSVDSTMKQWKGKEVSLFQNLIFKYGEEPAPEEASTEKESQNEESKKEETEVKPLVDEKKEEAEIKAADENKQDPPSTEVTKKEEEPAKPTTPAPTPAAEAKKLSPSPSGTKAPAKAPTKLPGKASPTKTPPAKAVAGKKASSASAVVVKPAANDAEWTTRLTAFYKKYNPEKLSSVDSTMKQWKGKEVSLFQNLIFKYGEEPVPEATEAKKEEPKVEESSKEQDTEIKPTSETKEDAIPAADDKEKDTPADDSTKREEEPAKSTTPTPTPTPAAEAKKLSPSPSSTKAPVKAPAKAPAKVPGKASPTKTSSSPTKTAPPKAVAGKKAASASAVVVKPAANDAEWTTRLTAFYKKYNPEKLSSVDSTMKQWKGKEVSLFQNLIFKYGEEPAPEVEPKKQEEEKKEEPKKEDTEVKPLVDEKKEEEVTPSAVEKKTDTPAAEVAKKEEEPAKSTTPAAEAKKLSPSPSSTKAPAKAPASPTKTPPPKAASAKDVVVKPAANDAEWKARFTAFYKKYNPEKLSTVDATMKQWKGKEVSLFQNLIFKYGEEPTSDDVSVASSSSSKAPLSTPSSPKKTTPVTSPAGKKSPAKKSPAKKSPASSAGGGAKAAEDAAAAYYRKRLEKFYAKWAPEKTEDEMKNLLTKFKGKEGTLFEALVKKWGPEPT